MANSRRLPAVVVAWPGPAREPLRRVNPPGFSREEEAMALKIGRLLDEGQLQIGCRLLGKDAPDAHLSS